MNETNPGHLARLLAAAPDESAGWGAGELAAILRHQLSVPVEFDLPGDACAVGDGYARALRPPAAPGHVRAFVTTTFGDLLRHPDPPLPLLRRVKDFAKACREDPRGPLPREVAMVLYLASILAAHVRHGVGITKLKPQELRKATEWGLSQEWLDDGLRALFGDALRGAGFCDDTMTTTPETSQPEEHGTRGQATL